LEEGLKNPYFGDDRQRVLARLGDLKQGEEIIDPVNTYLIIFLYSGIFGFVVFILLISGVAMKVWRKDGSARGDFTFLPVQGFLASALGAELTALLFTSFWERNPYWLMIILAGCKTLRITRSPATAEAKSRRLPGEVAETPALADHVHAGDLGAARG